MVDHSHPEPPADRAAERARLVEALRDRGAFRSERVGAALLAVPRERFLPPDAAPLAYHDQPVPIGYGQTASAPHMVAMMIEALDLRPGHHVLEVGAGSGYHAAVVAEAVKPGGTVVTVELDPALAAYARDNLDAAGYLDAVAVVRGDGGAGHPPRAPYDRVLVTCGAPTLPPPLVEQTRPGGRLVVPVGPLEAQDLFAFDKGPDGVLRRRPLGPVRFVPMRGEHGYPAPP